MERKIYIILTCIFLFVGCASMQNQSSFTENTFICDNPKLKVQILKNVLRQTEKSKQGNTWRRTNHWFKVSSSEFVGVAIWRFRHNSSSEWRSSDEQLLMNMGMVPLDRIAIDNKTWVKFAYLKYENSVQFGYFKRMNNNLVAVFCEIKNEKYKGEIESYKKTRVLTERHKQLINEAFDHVEKLFVIEKYIKPSTEATIQPKKMQELTPTQETSPTKKAIDRTKEAPKLALIPKNRPVDLESRASSGPPYKIAIFPWMLQNRASNYLNYTLGRTIYNIEEYSILNIKFSFYEIYKRHGIKILDNSVMRSDTIDNLWTKKTFWETNKPNVDLVCQIGEELNIDAVLMLNLDVGVSRHGRDGAKKIIIYLVDIKTGKLFSKKNTNNNLNFDHGQFSTEFDSLLSKLVNSYLNQIL